MDERLKFIARLLDGEKMAGLCREFGISRKTGYEILTRYNEAAASGEAGTGGVSFGESQNDRGPAYRAWNV